jgi:hypothetical protein
MLFNWKMSSEILSNNYELLVKWENRSTVLEILYDSTGKFISINKEVWKDLNLNFNRRK